MPAWFETWFDTPYYHVLYNHRNEEEAAAFIEKIFAHLQVPVGAKVLDVACGKGRHVKKLAALGYQAIGIDLSPQSIAAAQASVGIKAHFEVWDMREVYRPNSFSVVTNFFSSFGYFDNSDDDSRAIAAMAQNLLPKGLLIMDYMNPEAIVKQLEPRAIINRNGIQFHITKKIEAGFVRKEISFLADGEHHHYCEQLKLIKPEQFDKMLTDAGFQLLYRFGCYALSKFDAANSKRQIMVAQKG